VIGTVPLLPGALTATTGLAVISEKSESGFEIAVLSTRADEL